MSPGRQAIARGARAVDVDLDGGLAERGEHRKVGDALHRRQHRLDLVGGVGQRLQVVAEQLDRVLALHAGYGFGDVVLQILREVELDARKFLLQLRQQFRRQVVLVLALRPLLGRLQRREELGVEEARGVGAVVGAAVLGHHRFHFRQFRDQLAHLVDVGVALLQRDRRRQGRADPEVALLELRQEFEPEHANGDHRHQDQHAGRDQHHPAAGERPAQRRHVDAVQPAHDQGFGLLDMGGQDDRAQRRRHREGRKQSAGQRIGIGARHRREDVAFDAAQREQRQEGRDDDRRRKEDRTRHVGRRRQDGMMLHVHDGVGRDRLHLRFRKPLGVRQPAEDRLHHDHGGVDDQAEIDRADRQADWRIRRAAPGC